MNTPPADDMADKEQEHTLLHRRLEQRGERWQQFVDFLHMLSECGSTEAIARHVVNRIYLMFRVNGVTLALHDPVRDELAVVEERRFGRETRPGRTILPGQGLIGRCFAERRYLCSEKRATDSGTHPTAERRADQGGAVLRALPLISSGVCRGVLAAAWDEECGELDPADLNLLKTMTGCIAAALNNAALQEELRQRLHSVSAAREIAVLLSASLEPDEVFRHLFRGVETALQADIVSVMLLDPDGRTLRIAASQGLPADVATAAVQRLGEGIAGYVAREGYPLLVDNVEKDLRFRRRNHPRYGNRMAMCAPLKSRGKTLGVINVNSSRPRRAFTQHDLDLLSILSQHAACAIANALLHAEVTRLASTDSLTGLKNRRVLIEALEAERKRCERYGQNFALLLMDVDHFKAINDEHGHPAGDAVLRALAEVLQSNMREADVIARFGGEEFAVLLPSTDEHAARECAERLRAAAKEYARVPDRPDLCVTISVGGAVYPRDAANVVQLVQQADAALYGAKHGGRDRVCFVGADHSAINAERSA